MTAGRLLALAFAAYALLVAVFAGAELAIAGRVGPPIDDGWIYMAFARALAAGDGITYPGHDGPLAAVTGPVWCALLGVAFLVGGAGPVVAKANGVLWGAFAIWSVWRLGTAATGDRRLGAVAALAVAAAPRFVWGSLSVMEVPFYVAAVAWGLALHVERRNGPVRRWLPALLVLCLAGWARPECFVFPVLAALHRPRSLTPIAWCLGLLALYPAYHLWVYGHPLPTTFYAKAAAGSPWSVAARDGFWPALGASFVGPLEQVLKFAAWLPTHLPLLALGFVPGVVRGVRERRGTLGFVALSLLVFMLARGFLGVVEPSFQYGRYFGHTWALFAVVAVAGFEQRRVAWWPSLAVLSVIAAACVAFPLQGLVFVFDWIAPGASLTESDAVHVSRTGVVLGLVLLGAGALARPARPPALLAALFVAVAAGFGAVRTGRNVADTYVMNVAMAEHVRTIVPAGETVVCHDIGALGYFSERPLLDLAGLGSPDVVFADRLPNGRIDALAILVERRPRWLCMTGAMFAIVMGGTLENIPGLIGVVDHVTIERPENITLLGTRYHLLELQWAQ